MKGSLHDWISALIRRDKRKFASLCFCHVRTQQEGSCLQAGRGLSPEHDHACTLILDFPDPRTVRNICYLSHPYYNFPTEA